MPTESPHFTRDPSLSSEIADQFGGGAGNAEQLINANALRWSEELSNAQLAAINDDLAEELELDTAKIAKAADIDEEQILEFSVRGDRFVVFGFVGPDLRVGKDVLLIEDGGKLAAIDRPETPERAALRAQVAASRKVSEARSEAEKVLEDARAEAAKILADAAAKAAQDSAKAAEQATKDAAKDAKDKDAGK